MGSIKNIYDEYQCFHLLVVEESLSEYGITLASGLIAIRAIEM